MNCSTSRSSHYNTHLYHPYSRNAPFIGGQEPADATSLKSFNQQLGINCSVNQLNAGLPEVGSNSYAGLLATVSKPNGAYHSPYQFDNGQFGHLGHLSSHLNGQLSNLSHDLSNSLNGQPERTANDLSSLANHSTYSSQLDQLSQFNQLNSSEHLNHLADQPPNEHHSDQSSYASNQTSVIVCNAKPNIPNIPSIPTPSSIISGSSVTSLPGAFPGDASRGLENDDEIDLVMAYISSSQDEQRKMYSNQNLGNHPELAAHQINKENHNQSINNQVSSSD